MAIGLLIITHNTVGQQILDTAGDIIGKQLPIEVQCVSVTANSDYEKILNQCESCIDQLDTGDGVLILTDIFGATPCNIAIKATAKTNARVVCGLNLPMLIRIINYANLELEALITKSIQAGHDSIFECGR